MARVPAVTRESVPESQSSAFDQVVETRGGIPAGGPGSVMLNAPEVALRVGDLALFMRSQTSLEPRIRERICVVALGGWPYHAADFHDFNFIQDLKAAQAVFDSGVALVQVTGFGVSELLRTTRWEMMEHVKGRGEVGDYLFRLYEDFVDEYPGRSKPIWDLAPGAWLLNSDWLKTHIEAAPILNDDLRYIRQATRHPMRIVDWMDRDAIFSDFFEKLRRNT